MGELGEDGGGLSREFWTILSKEIKSSSFEGSTDSGGCCPRHDALGLQVLD